MCRSIIGKMIVFELDGLMRFESVMGQESPIPTPKNLVRLFTKRPFPKGLKMGGSSPNSDMFAKHSIDVEAKYSEYTVGRNAISPRNGDTLKPVS